MEQTWPKVKPGEVKEPKIWWLEVVHSNRFVVKSLPPKARLYSPMPSNISSFFTVVKLRGEGDELFLAPDQVQVEEKHFAVGATCKMYKGSLAPFSNLGNIPIALKESTVPVTRRPWKRSVEKEVGLFKQLHHENVIKF